MEKNELESKVKAKQQVIDDVVAKLTNAEKSEYEKRKRTYLYAVQNKNATNIERNGLMQEMSLYEKNRMKEFIICGILLAVFSLCNYFFEFVAENKLQQYVTTALVIGAFYVGELKLKEMQHYLRDRQLKDKVELYEFELSKIGNFVSYYSHMDSKDFADNNFDDFRALQNENGTADYCIQILEYMCVAGGLQYKAKQIME